MATEMVRKDDRSIGELFSELASETSTLIRQEVALAQVEITQKATAAGKNVGYLAVGGFIGYAGLLAVLAGVIIGLSYFMPPWLAAFGVGVIVGVIAYVMISSALTALRTMDMTPTETVESIKEDARWLKNQVS
ncbi:MAG: phage holin family protein [Pyrinomonadaceae bacterium]